MFTHRKLQQPRVADAFRNAAVEEHRHQTLIDRLEGLDGIGEHTLHEGGVVLPGRHRTALANLLLDDLPANLIDTEMAAVSQRRDDRGFAGARGAGHDEEVPA
jgi:hypothetical protein